MHCKNSCKMRWFRRNSSDRTLDDDNGPQLLRLTSLNRRRSPSNSTAADNRTPPATARETPDHSAREFLRPSTTTLNGFSRGRLPVNRNGKLSLVHLSKKTKTFGWISINLRSSFIVCLNFFAFSSKHIILKPHRLVVDD